MAIPLMCCENQEAQLAWEGSPLLVASLLTPWPH
jgi:hypothetical protein